MTTVAQFIAFMQTMPQDAEVEVVRARDYGSVYTESVEITPEWEGAEGSRNVEIFDFRKNPHIKETSQYFGKVVVTIGTVE